MMEEIMERKPSIETEPRTLNVHQINRARDAARYVMNTTTLDNALRIFTKGLVPVVRCEEDDQRRKLDEEDQRWAISDVDDNHKSGDGDLRLRDIVSAPF